MSIAFRMAAYSMPWSGSIRSGAIRPLRYEKYWDKGAGLRWKLLHDRIDSIRLQKIDGIWFPVYGEARQFSWDFEPAPGFARDDFKDMDFHSDEEAFATGMLVVTSRPSCLFTVQVDPATVVLNKGVPAERFSISFPKGTLVHDDFLQTDYEVGGVFHREHSPSYILTERPKPGSRCCKAVPSGKGIPSAIGFFRPRQDGSDYRDVVLPLHSEDGVSLEHSEISNKALSISWRVENETHVCG